jgi:hypothetical protein
MIPLTNHVPTPTISKKLNSASLIVIISYFFHHSFFVECNLLKPTIAATAHKKLDKLITSLKAASP